MKQNNRRIGAEQEKIAGTFLMQQGYEILSYNFYTRAGEIDIVAKHGQYLVFVEVKYRKNASSGHPLEAISIQKQKKISKCALYYMKMHGIDNVPVRFDVVSILGEEITILQNAFEFII